MPAQRSGAGAGGIEIRGNMQNEPLIHHDAIGVTAVSDAAEMLVGKIIGEDEVRTILLQACLAFGAGAVGIDQATDGGEIPNFELSCRRADPGYAPDDLMTGDARINCGHYVVPLVAGLMEVRVAHAAKEDFDLHVVIDWLAARDCGGRELRSCARSGVSFGVVHEFVSSYRPVDCSILSG